MPDTLEETGSSSLESQTINIYRTAATVKGGRRFSFGALVVVGDRRGRVGYGYGKSNEVPTAIEKAEKYAKRDLIRVPMAGHTLPHEVQGRFSSSVVRMIPASPGTGVVAGGAVRTVLEMAGITDCLAKCFGSTNKLNTIKAVFEGLGELRTREQVAELRGVEIASTEIEKRIERGQRFMPTTPESGEKMRAPVNTIGQDRGRGGGRGRGGRGGGRGRGGGGRGGSGGGGSGGQGGPPSTDGPASQGDTQGQQQTAPDQSSTQ